MKIIKKENKVIDSFGNGGYESTIYTVKVSEYLLDGVVNTPNADDDKIIEMAEKEIVKYLFDARKAYWEMVNIVPEFTVHVYGEERPISELDYYATEDAESQIINGFAEAYTSEFEDLYCECKSTDPEIVDEWECVFDERFDMKESLLSFEN